MYMLKKTTRLQVSRKAEQLIHCSKVDSLESLLRLPRFTLTKDIFLPQYYSFRLRKSNGGYREIEAPAPDLKKTQRKLNEYLQCVYYSVLTPAAYGFIINPRKQEPKNIVTNAAKHLGCNFLLNIDFDDFFHQLSQDRVFKIFQNAPFQFHKNTANLLAKLCTYKGRLPMGAPTSPVLSNFACISMDKELQQWADNHNITYTRFVDDLSFSSKQLITQQDFLEIIRITEKHQLKVDPDKTKWYDKSQIKTVTGLVLGDKVEILKEYYEELDRDLDRLQKAIEVHIITGLLYKAEAIKKFKQEVMGKINFIAVVMGYDNEIFQNYLDKYENVTNPPDNELSVRWLKFSNYTM
jgi:RNA-directed DNA polymerase